MSLIEVGTVSFLTSFIFALGGLGSAVILIPILVFLGVPFNLARATGLFTNFISTSSVTLFNLQKKNVDFKTALPIILSSIVFSPVGAYTSHILPERLVGILFTAFLFFAGTMIYIPKKSITKEEGNKAILYSVLVGSIAGFISGLLGVGGGGIISPLLILLGFDPKKVASITALTVPFSSFTGFIAYWKIGGIDWSLTLSAAIPAALAGYLAGYISHSYLKPSHVKKLLGILFYILGIKFLLKYI